LCLQKRRNGNAAKERERWARAVRTVVKASRNDADCTQEELGDRIGLTRDQIANLELGRRGIAAHEFIMIAKALDLSPEVLLQRVLRWA
jgi:transcriptional regulator with XRE-family HTH domain